jgi:hypothetical protein
MDRKFKEIAKAELGEDDLKRQQSLEHFREWLSKHPYLQGMRQGLYNINLGQCQTQKLLF